MRLQNTPKSHAQHCCVYVRCGLYLNVCVCRYVCVSVVVVVCVGARDHYLRSAMQLGTPKVQILSPPLGVLGIF